MLCLHPFLFDNSLLLHCFCWHIAKFNGALPPLAVNQQTVVFVLCIQMHMHNTKKRGGGALIKTLLQTTASGQKLHMVPLGLFIFKHIQKICLCSKNIANAN